MTRLMIEDIRTGERIATVVLPIVLDDLQSLGRGWFDWAERVKTTEVFKLVNPAASDRVLGLIALIRHKNWVEITLLEVNPNDVGRGKNFRGIAGNLIAFAAELSFKIGGEGFLGLEAKTKLIDHYRRTYGFEQLGNSQMMQLTTVPAANLIRQYLEGPKDA